MELGILFSRSSLRGLYGIIKFRDKNFLDQNLKIKEKESSYTSTMEQQQIIQPFTKEQYQRTLREKRVAFVESNFSEKLNEVFNFLRNAANQEELCHHSFDFNIPRNLDIDNVEQTLRSYFSDYGYTTIPEPRKEGGKQRTISITLT